MGFVKISGFISLINFVVFDLNFLKLLLQINLAVIRFFPVGEVLFVKFAGFHGQS